MWNEFWPWPFMFFGPLMMMLFIIVVCLGMMYLMRGHRARGSNAVEILKERFARGEINQSEYEERRRLLEA